MVQNKIVVGDSARYTKYAMGLLTNNSFSNFGALTVPGYPVFLAVVYSLFGIKPWLILLLQILMDTGIAIIVYFIAKDVFQSKKIALISAFLYSINFLSAYYSIRLLTEILFTFLFTLSILFFIKGLKKNKLSVFALAGLFAALATLVRPIAQYFPAVFLIILMLNGTTISQKLRNIAVLLLVFCAVISPWQLRNLRTYGYYSLSTTPGHVIGRAGTMLAKVNAENISRGKALEELVGNSLEGVTNPFEESKIYEKIAISYIVKNPFQYAKYFSKRIVMMYFGTARTGILDLFAIKAKPFPITEGIPLTAHKIIANLYNELPTLVLLAKQTLEYLFVVIGLVIVWPKDKRIFALLLIVIICYFTALSGVLAYSR
ncbi:MAG: glycosyltransferase family 39 protein, partial [Candidatus Omnitrophica bacterium]|nr:glycosyltransferase family 39 protein [Candidatus Omnitrophota bacterium]